MLKGGRPVIGLGEQAQAALLSLLDRVPRLNIHSHTLEMHVDRDHRLDLVVDITAGGQDWTLVCEITSNGQPRHVRAALHEMDEYRQHNNSQWVSVLIAPYLSPQARKLCVDDDVSYVDLHGNARLIFGNTFIEREAAGSPAAEAREMKSLFKPKASQVLRVMLQDPARPWRVTDISEAAGVSIGHVSNVRNALLAREWASVVDGGLAISEPDQLLDAWAEDYEPPMGKRLRFYTPLHGSALQQAIGKVVGARAKGGTVVLASFSAAQWIAPFGRHSTQFFYCDNDGLERLVAELGLERTAKGENVAITVLKDDGLFRDTIMPAEGIRCTGAVQTYLDLSASGERGKEAAELLRQEKLSW